ncbi:hypothetical protein BO71DRAFT_429766 [Aspergillus ellipticus CBS 707.79]|uniref:Uncharacterized protein n=1 Tax=Aspergillus ellipticus CBS 707.79 TaxID=1448320 RepID=A0A319DB69_9EURO|nr:hypothetical protein BO71DRAFT_429766 [Aspergillus ellipticus CBS 707.79]
MAKTPLKGLVPAAIFEKLKYIDPVSSIDDTVEDAGMASFQSQWWDNLPDYQMHLFLREATEYSLRVDHLKDQSSGADELLRFMPHVAKLVDKIKGWQPHVSTVPSEYVESVQHFNDVWRLGMLCFVYSEIYAMGPGDDFMQECVEASLVPIQKLSWLQAALFPVFMIAVHAHTEESREIFCFKLTEMHAALGFQAPLSVVSILRNLWERSDGTGAGKAQWREVIRDLGIELNILL